MNEELKICTTCEQALPPTEYHTRGAKARYECNTCRSMYNRFKHYASHTTDDGRKVIRLADGREVLVVDAVRGLRLRGYTYLHRPRDKSRKPDITDDTANALVDALGEHGIQLEPPADGEHDA